MKYFIILYIMRTKVPETTFVRSPETESERILDTGRSVVDGFFQRKGFAVLPSLPTAGDPGVVVLPRLPYHQIPNFWQRVGSLDRQLPMHIPADLQQGVMALLEPEYDRHRLNQRKQSWIRVAGSFWGVMDEYPRMRHLIGSVECW